VKRLWTAIVAVSAAVTWAAAVAPAWPAAAGMTAGARPPGAGDASAVGAARPAGSWGTATAVSAVSGAVPAATSFAEVNSVSCASAGDCTAGGTAVDRHGQQGFVAVERNGRWGTAIGVPGLAALNTGEYVEVMSVSCGSAGSCAAGGFYESRHGQQGLVAVERNGVWGTATEMPGPAA